MRVEIQSCTKRDFVDMTHMLIIHLLDLCDMFLISDATIEYYSESRVILKNGEEVMFLFFGYT